MNAIRNIHILLFITLGFSAAQAVTISQPWHRGTEASLGCESGLCAAEAPKSNLQNFCEDLKSRAKWAQDWNCQNIAIYDDGNDRDILYDLRKKPFKSLSAEEKAILQAADRYGNVGFCKNNGGNASLIIHNGRPAIITSAHMILDYKTGKYKCSESDLRKASYMPNTSYYDQSAANQDKSFTHKKIALEFPPVEMERRNLGGGFHPGDDFVIFYLKEDITKDIMPNGNARGAMSLATSPAKSGKTYMIGVAPDVKQGLAVVNQKCDYQTMPGIGGFRHTCDVLKGSSGSLMTVMQGDELMLYGIHTGGTSDPKAIPLPTNYHQWNFATEFPGNAKF